MDAVQMRAKMLAARREWFLLDAEQPEGKALQIQRPTETEMLRWSKGFDPAKILEVVAPAVVGWRNFKESDLLPPGIGGEDEQEFDRAIFELWASDHSKELIAVGTRLISIVNEHQAKRADLSGN